MKFSVEWLKDLSGSRLKAEQLAELLSDHTAEAESEIGRSFPQVVVADVVKAEKHPNADRLRVIELTDGEKTYSPIVCGAWNFDVGARVALALPGANIPHDQHDPEGKSFVLGKATIRGVESQGMICSAKELGLGDEGGGILLLDGQFKLGDELKTGEEVLEVSAFANRPDLHSYIGLAREIAALSGSAMKKLPLRNIPKKDQKFPISIKNKKHCARYSAIKLSGVKVGPSPEFIAQRLRASGLRPINNVVDATNYVMLLTAQPMHAFDASKIDSEIIVRNAEQSEKILTLDNVERTLRKDQLVIADRSKILAIAGVIGGMDSRVDENTTEVILEVANFDAVSIRKTARTQNIRTDASSRFEKSLPLGFIPEAIELALALLEDHTGAKVVSHTTAGDHDDKSLTVAFNTKQINQLLGTDISATEQKDILEKFGLKISGSAAMKAQIPAWRPDLQTWEDLSEEIIRYKGLDYVPAIPSESVFSAKHSDPLVDFREKLADLLVGLGLSEIYSYSFVPDTDHATLEIANPLNDEQKYLRTNIFPGMIKTAALNSRFFNEGMYFEFGNVYRKSNNNYSEAAKLGILAFDKKEFPSASLNGAIARIAEVINCKLEFLQISEDNADIILNGKAVGTVQILAHPELKAVGASIDLRQVHALAKQFNFRPMARFPQRALDTSLILHENTPWSLVVKTAGKEPLLASLQLIDTYTGEGIAAGEKSLTIRAIYQAPDRTLTDQEANSIHQQILAKISQKLQAKIRP